MPDTTVSDASRAVFESWAQSKAADWFGYDEDELDIMFARDGGGYVDAGLHSAWMGWQAYRDACGHSALDALLVSPLAAVTSSVCDYPVSISVNNEVTDAE